MIIESCFARQAHLFYFINFNLLKEVERNESWDKSQLIQTQSRIWDKLDTFGLLWP